VTSALWIGVALTEARATDDDGGSVSAVQSIWEVPESMAARLKEQLCGLLGEPEAEQLLDGPAAMTLVDAMDRSGIVVLRAAQP
jgi:hypothetical protein